MIKKWLQFINENVVNPDSYIDVKMQEIKDLIDSVENLGSLIYEWENKNDHQLYVNFSTNGMSLRYEFDIDDMLVTKIAGETVDFTENVESIEEGIEIIEKDIHSILGISESKAYSDNLIVGKKYRITHPCYDDYDEGLEPEVEEVEVLRKLNNGYLFKNQYDNEYTTDLNWLNDCEIEEISEKARTPGEKYKGKHIPAKYLTRKKRL